MLNEPAGPDRRAHVVVAGCMALLHGLAQRDVETDAHKLDVVVAQDIPGAPVGPELKDQKHRLPEPLVGPTKRDALAETRVGVLARDPFLAGATDRRGAVEQPGEERDVQSVQRRCERRRERADAWANGHVEAASARAPSLQPLLAEGVLSQSVAPPAQDSRAQTRASSASASPGSRGTRSAVR